MHVPFLQPNITEADIREVVRVLRSGWLVLCEETRKFESAFADYLGVKEAVLTNSCTCSLELALDAAEIGEGDEVITTPLTYASSVSPILRRGGTHIFVDVDPETGLINIDQVRKAVTKRTKAILPVHLYGQMADMRSLGAIAREHKLLIIEDAAHAIESQRDGIRPGQQSFAACFSFHTAKNLTAGQGGMLVTQSAKVADRTRLLRRDGIRNVGIHRRMEALGYKYLSTDFQAALLRNELKRIEVQWRRRKELYDAYADAFTASGIRFNETVPGSKHACHMLVLWVDPKKRDRVIGDLSKAGIEVSIHYDPLHLEPYYKKTFGYGKGDFPVTESLGLGTITLPLHPRLSDKQQAFVISRVKKALR
jgi:dTDP-4-amino-4,6-dideoxygalactose transaminase